jgi:polyisoprenoid-binding protein YceI
MKRVFVLIGIAFVLFAAISQTDTKAKNLPFDGRFGDSKKVVVGDSGVYNFDKAHSFISFRVGHNGLIEVPGFFRDFTGSVSFDSKDITKSAVEFTAKATSIDTGVAGRDNHLRSKDFFEVEKFPDITFKSTKVERKGKNWMITGDFTMKGVTKSIAFPFTLSGFLPANERNGGRMGISAETTINRRDFGVNYDAKLPSGLQVVSDQVKVILQIEAVKPKDTPKAE